MGGDAEFIVICIDNSYQASCRNNYQPQLDAVKHYCKAKFNDNPDTEVVLFTMGSKCFGFMHPANLQQILDFLPDIEIEAGTLWFKSAIKYAQVGFDECPPNKQKRMLFLVGGLVDLDGSHAVEYGLRLKKLGIAVDVVNFYLGGRLIKTRIAHQFGGVELDAFVGAAKSKDNSHIAHIKPGSSIRDALFEYILKHTPRLLTEGNHHKTATWVEQGMMLLGKRKAVSATGNDAVGQEEEAASATGVKLLGKRTRQPQQQG